MKNFKLIIVALLISTFTSFSQEKCNDKDSLHVVFRFQKNDKLYLCDKVDVFLLKEIGRNSPKKLILKSQDSRFDFVFSETQLKGYKYIKFTNNKHNLVVKIDSLPLVKFGYVDIHTKVEISKPAIYLYSPTKKSFKITLKFKGQLGTTYPKYDNGWKVTTDSTGRMLNEKDNRKYNYLFWDGTCNFEAKHFDYKNGFYVNRFEYSSFLEEKLKLIGLKEQEINDFVVYWLPIMNKYPICFVHFWINDNIDQTAFIETTPKTNSQIRVFMEFKGYTDIIGAPALSEQKLTTIKRKGITLVEWGGSEIGSKKIQ